MLKVRDTSEIFMLRNQWHDKIEKEKKIKNLPYKFKIVKELEGEKNPAYIALDDEKKKVSIVITETVLKYINGEEVPDCNVGMYFKDYLPNENTYLLVNDKDKILPVRFVLSISDIEIDGTQYTMIDLVLKHLVLDEQYTIYGKRNNMWKFIVYNGAIENAVNKVPSEKTLDQAATSISMYMDDVEKMYQDTIIHKTVVKYIADKFANYLENVENLPEDANELRERAIVHDNSKLLNKTEFQALTGIINDKSCLRDSKAALTAYKQDAIELHWKNNSHHPEHYEKPTDMKRVDRYEFVCDCCARSIQYGTELVDFMKTRQEQRFHFPEIMFDEILRYCKIVINL